MNKHKKGIWIVFPLLSAVVLPVYAHTGIGTISGFVDGFSHPWQGVDHLLAMIAVGVWAAVSGGSRLWLLPATFLMAMAAGAWLSFAGLTLSGAEFWVAGSVLALGLMLALNVSLSVPAVLALITVCALGHGYLHAAEIGGNADGFAYAVGFLLATAMLHAAGMAAAFTGPKVLRAMRVCFAVVCSVVGALLLAGI